MTSEYGHVIDVDVDFDAAIDKVTNALEMEGFGVLAHENPDMVVAQVSGYDVVDYGRL